MGRRGLEKQKPEKKKQTLYAQRPILVLLQFSFIRVDNFFFFFTTNGASNIFTSFPIYHKKKKNGIHNSPRGLLKRIKF